MLVKITEADGATRYVNGTIEALSIDVKTKTLYMKVTGITTDFLFTIKGNAEITESEGLHLP